MTTRRSPLLIHLLGAAAASALAAYWVLRLLAPGSSIVPPAAPAVAIREPDAGLAGRLFGDVSSGPAAVSLNVQVTGVFAAGADSSAVVAVEGRPSRAVLLGQEVAAGLRLVEVHPDGVTLEHDGVRTHYAVPPLSVATSTAPAAMFRRDGDTLTAPSQDPASAAKAPGSARSLLSSTPVPAPLAAPAQPAVNPPAGPVPAAGPGIVPANGAPPRSGAGG